MRTAELLSISKSTVYLHLRNLTGSNKRACVVPHTPYPAVLEKVVRRFPPVVFL
ncbi:MAG: hypothetical protein ACLU9S_05060 [Oscillospiraceae bacterium]